MRLFAGVDGGGTKTACVLSDEKGFVLGRGVGGPSNYLYCGKETASRSVQDALLLAFRDARLAPCRLDTCYIASAAIATFAGEKHVPFFKSCADTSVMLCEGDIYPIRYAAVRDRPAAVTIAGTGAITYVFTENGFHRVGGWGPTLGDEGSGYDIGRTAMRTALRMFDGRETEDSLFYSTLMQEMQTSDARYLVSLIRDKDERSMVASAAKTVCELYETGNPTAQRILKYAADEILLSVKAACMASGLPNKIPLILSGSLVRPERPLYRLLAEGITEAVGISELLSVQTEPEFASLALALKHAGLEEASERVLNNRQSSI